MAKPLIAAETIYDTALQVLDAEGADGLSARSLANALQCSTRTLYQQVGKREDLIRQLLDHYFSRATLDFKKAPTWQDSAMAWASAMRRTLMVHPNLSRLITIENRGAIADYVNELLKALLNEGFPQELALRSCRVLAHIVISLTLAEIDTPPIPVRRRRRTKKEIQFEDLVIAGSGSDRNRNRFQDTPEVFANAVRWVIHGIEVELTANH